MSEYKHFAKVYASGDYPHFSREMANLLPSLLETLGYQPKTLLDVACGEGTFANAMTKMGYEVTGIDQSEEMLRIAKEKARQTNLNTEFYKMDMRELKLPKSFDLVTCWFDSLNYLLKTEDLYTTFNRIQHHLNKGGFFIFDMNTIYWLTTLAKRHSVTIEKETSDFFQVHKHSFDKTTNIATFHLIAFSKENNCWLRRVDEKHQERGYAINEIRANLQKARLTEIKCWGNFEQRAPVTPESKRVWFLAQKQ